MKKTILINGLIAGFIVTAMMVTSSLLCYKNPNFEGSMVLGYLGMLLAFSFVFVGIKSYRDKHNSGTITFGEAFKIGLFITLIASTVYVAVWLVEYYFFIPDFMEKYTAHVLKQAAEKGATAAEIQNQTAQMETYKEWYKNPILIILMTYAEILPIGLVVTLISALILKRNQKPEKYTTA